MKPRAHNFVDRSGMKFGSYTVIKFSRKNKHRQTMWLCKCVCGKKVEVQGATLAGGRSKSCGCIGRIETAKKHTTHDESHGPRRTPEYVCWLLMRARCKNPKSPSYHRYGGRGIIVCKRWDSYQNFLSDMGRKPSPKHSIERNNNNGNYKPHNCKWATQLEQSNNREQNRIVKFGQITLTTAE